MYSPLWRFFGSVDGFVSKKNPGHVVNSDTTRVDFETFKARMIFVPMLLIPKSSQEAEIVVATRASKVDIAEVILQEDSEGHLRPCAYRARKLKDVETGYSAYEKEALVIVEDVSRIWSGICSVVNASQWSLVM